MKKEVFTQEFDKCFTVFQQVQLMKKYLEELLQQEIPEVDISGKVDKTTTFTDTNGNTYNGTTNWIVEDDKLAYETKIHSSLLGDYNAYVHIGEDSIYLYNHYINVSMDNEYFSVNCDVNEGYYIVGRVNSNGQSAVTINAGTNHFELSSDSGLLYNSQPLGLHNQYCKIAIQTDQSTYEYYKILLQTFKPITTLEEFRDYIRKIILPTDEPDFNLHTLKIPLWSNNYPDYILFQNAYYGSASCSVSQYMGVTNDWSSIIEATDISVVIGRISEFEVLYDVIS